MDKNNLDKKIEQTETEFKDSTTETTSQTLDKLIEHFIVEED